MKEGFPIDLWFEIASIVEGCVSTFLFFYLIFFYEDKCPRCIARDEIEKSKNDNTVSPKY